MQVFEQCDQAVTTPCFLFRPVLITLIALCCGDDQFSCAFYLRLAMFPWELLVIPREAKGYSFGLVRLSVRPSRSFFDFVRL